ncbi:MAG: hypothetical protein JXR96_29565 [Deltaproteobacteria bacterium]|nr:hypothetical protein [Deltaproteobacteria bacterium]
MSRALVVWMAVMLSIAGCGDAATMGRDGDAGEGDAGVGDGDAAELGDDGGAGADDGDPGGGDECTPETCESLGLECGQWSDGCGGMLACGGCPQGQACDEHGHCQSSCDGHCDNGSQDCGETAVDCGGDCLPCELCVYPDNPRYFSYAGKPIYLVGGGQDSVPNAANMDILKAAGANEYRSVVATYTSHANFMPYVYGNPGTDSVDNNWGGWKESYWNGLQAEVQRAKARDVIIFPLIFGTPMLECQNGDPECDDYRWAFNLWSVRNGGPIDAGTSAGKPYFYTLHDDDHFIFGNETYSAGWSWQKKNQYRQEELLAEVMARLPEDTYLNVGILLMWEIDDGWPQGAEAWARHMVAFLKSLRTSCRPIAICTARGDRVQLVGADFGLHEGHNIVFQPYTPPANVPIIYEGYNPRDDCYDPGDTHPGCQCFDGDPEPGRCTGYSDDEECNAAISKQVMRKAILDGMNSSFPFRSYWWQRSSSIYNDCYPDAWDYNIENVKHELLDYGTRLQAVLDSVETWEDEPGDELIPATVPES